MFKRLKNLRIPLIIILLMIPQLAFAQGEAREFSQTITALFEWVYVIMLFLQAFIWPVLLMIGSLMNNDLLFSGGMHTILLTIWSLIRDFVNVFFVLIILGVAIVNIMGVNKEEYQLRKVLPKIVIALIAVNFSFLGCKVFLDTVNVVSTAIFAVPIEGKISDVKDDTEAARLAAEICPNLESLASQAQKTDTLGDEGAKVFKKLNWCEPAAENPGDQAPLSEQAVYKLTSAGKNFFASFNQQNVALVLAVELMNITKLDDIDRDSVGDIGDLTINTLFSIVFFVIYSTAFVALFVTLLVRIIVLWITIALSPLMALGIIGLSKFTDRFGFEGEKAIGKMFVQHALIPVPIAVVLTIGTLMVNGLKKATGGQIIQYEAANSAALTPPPVSDLQSIIAGLATAAFIWMAVKEATSEGRGADFVKTITGSVENFGTSLAKSPLYIPFLHVKTADGKKANVGLAALPQLAGKGSAWQRKKDSEYAQLFQGGLTPEKAGENFAKAGTAAERKESLIALAQQPAADNTAIEKAIAKNILAGLEKDPALTRQLVQKNPNILQRLKEGTLTYGQLREALGEEAVKKAPERRTEAKTEGAIKAAKEVGLLGVAAALAKSAEELDAAAKSQTAEKSQDSDFTRARASIEGAAENAGKLKKDKDKIQITDDGKFNGAKADEHARLAFSINDKLKDVEKMGVIKTPQRRADLTKALTDAGIEGPGLDNLVELLMKGTRQDGLVASPETPAKQ